MASDCMPILAELSAINTFVSGLGDLKLGLTTNPTPPTPATANWASISEPVDCDWYSQEDTSAYGAYIDAVGTINVPCVGNVWEYGSSSAAAVTITGYWVGVVSPSTTTSLLQVGVLPTPVVMQSNGNAVVVEPNLQFAQIPLSS